MGVRCAHRKIPFQVAGQTVTLLVLSWGGSNLYLQHWKHPEWFKSFDDHLESYSVYDPPHDKTNKMTVRPAKTQIRLGIRPVWSHSSLCVKWVAKDPSFPSGCPDWSESSLGAHASLLVLSWGGPYFITILFANTNPLLNGMFVSQTLKLEWNSVLMNTKSGHFDTHKTPHRNWQRDKHFMQQ